MAYPEISFTLYIEQNRTKKLHIQLPSSRLKARVASLLGKDFSSKLLTIQEKNDLMDISGYIGKPEAAKKASGEQWLFVNKRYVRNHYLQHAVRMAYEHLITEKYHPFFVLFLDIDYQKVDVNIHPSKMEIKFETDDTKKAYTLLEAVTRKALGKYHTGIDFSLHANFTQYLKETSSSAPPKNALSGKERNWAALQEASLLENQYNFHQPNKLPVKRRAERPEPFSAARNQGVAPSSSSSSSSSTRNRSCDQIFEGAHELPLSQLSEEDTTSHHLPFFHINKQYICKPLRRGLLVIDRKRAQERVLYELFSQQVKQGSSQRLIFPQKVTFSEEDILLFKHAKGPLLDIGFTFDITERSELMVTGLPSDASTHEIQVLFEEILECLSKSYNIQSKVIEDRKKFWHLLAQRLSAVTPSTLEEVEMRTLMDKLYACKQPNYTPKGEYISKILDTHLLTQFFNT